MTAADAVLAELRLYAGQFVCARVLAEAAGFRFGARVHELRQSGYPIETAFPCRCNRCQDARRRARSLGRPGAYLGKYRLAERQEAAS